MRLVLISISLIIVISCSNTKAPTVNGVLVSTINSLFTQPITSQQMQTNLQRSLDSVSSGRYDAVLGRRLSDDDQSRLRDLFNSAVPLMQQLQKSGGLTAYALGNSLSASDAQLVAQLESSISKAIDILFPANRPVPVLTGSDPRPSDFTAVYSSDVAKIASVVSAVKQASPADPCTVSPIERAIALNGQIMPMASANSTIKNSLCLNKSN